MITMRDSFIIKWTIFFPLRCVYVIEFHCEGNWGVRAVWLYGHTSSSEAPYPVYCIMWTSHLKIFDCSRANNY